MRGFLGRLRFDLILNKTIVLTDAMLLDGAFFADFEPADLVREIGRSQPGPLPLEIRARNESLDGALLAFLPRPGPNGFVFSLIDDEAKRAHVAKELRSDMGGKSITAIAQLRDTIGSLVGDIDLAERLYEHWGRWLAAAEEGLVPVRPWAPSFRFRDCLKEYLEQDQLETQIFPIGVTNDDLRTRAIAWREDPPTRSQTYQEMDRLLEPGGSSDDRDQVMILRLWFDRAYNRALAKQHGCAPESLSANPRPANLYTAILQEAIKRHPQSLLRSSIEVPEPFLRGLAWMEGEMFQRLFSEAEPHLTEWWTDRNSDALRRGIMPFVKYVENMDRVPKIADRLNSVVKVAAHLGLAGIDVLEMLGGSIPDDALIHALPPGQFDQLVDATIEQILKPMVSVLVDHTAGRWVASDTAWWILEFALYRQE